MIPFAVTVVVLAVIAMVAQQKRIERMEARHNRLVVIHSRTCDRLADERRKHLATYGRLVRAERQVRRTGSALVEAGAESARHADHLEALLDATSEKPLSLVKGGRS